MSGSASSRARSPSPLNAQADAERGLALDQARTACAGTELHGPLAEAARLAHLTTRQACGHCLRQQIGGAGGIDVDDGLGLGGHHSHRALRVAAPGLGQPSEHHHVGPHDGIIGDGKGLVRGRGGGVAVVA